MKRLPPLNDEDRRTIRRLLPTMSKRKLARVWGISKRRVAVIARLTTKSGPR